jgi:hypothetical protein
MYGSRVHQKQFPGWAWWYMSIIPATPEVEVKDRCPSLDPGKSKIPYLKNKLKTKELGAWLKW